MTHSSEVAELDAKRLQLQRDLDVLEKQRATLLAQQAPIRRIVDDILAYIFELGALEEVYFPEKISSVSRHWRNLILQTPTAWSNLVLDRRTNIQSFIRRSEVFLSRSQSAYLTIILDFLPLPFDNDVHQLMNLLHGHFDRCQVLHMNIDTNWLSIIADSLSSLGPALRELDIRTSHTNANPVSLSLTEVNDCLPLLQSLSFSNLPPSSLPATQFPALKHLQLHGLQWQFANDGSHEQPWTATAALLESSPNLHTLQLNRMEFILDGAELLTPRKIVLKRLRQLTFECMETRSIAIVLESIEAPELKSLRMRYDPTKMGDHWCIHRLEAPCLTGIEELEVEGYAIYGSNLPWFLRTLAMVPRLTKLTIAHPPLFLDARFFDLMSNGPNWLVPRLTDIHLTACANLHVADLLRLLRARSVHGASGVVSPIRSLTLRVPPWNLFEEEDLRVLRLNVEDLLQVTLDPYHTDRFVVPQSPMFRATTPPPLLPGDHAGNWDAPPLLGTPFGTEDANIPFIPPPFPTPPTYTGQTGTATSTSTRRSTSPSSRVKRPWPVLPDSVQNIATVLLIASATALTTSFACYRLFSISRHVQV